MEGRSRILQNKLREIFNERQDSVTGSACGWEDLRLMIMARTRGEGTLVMPSPMAGPPAGKMTSKT